LNRPLVIGHRGAKGHVAENTLASFHKAIELGADGVEFDVHLSADGEVIVIHDDWVNRTSDGSGKVSELTCAEIKAIRIDGIHEIPTLSETLEILPDVLINIELKTAAAAEPVCELLRKNYTDFSRFIISSFDWVALKQVRSSHPEIPIGVLTETDVALALAFAHSIKAETLHPHFLLLSEEIMESAKQQNVGVFAWTLNRTEDIERMKNLGVSGIITDYPDRIK